MNDQHLLKLSEAADQLSQLYGRPISLAAVRRWAAKGVNSPKGLRVFLLTKRVGGRVFTTQASLSEFLSLCAGTETRGRQRGRRRNGESAARQLLKEKHGFSYGPTPQNDLPDLPPTGGDQGALQGVLPVRPLRARNAKGNRATVNRRGAHPSGSVTSQGRLHVSLGTVIGGPTAERE